MGKVVYQTYLNSIFLKKVVFSGKLYIIKWKLKKIDKTVTLPAATVCLKKNKSPKFSVF